MGSGLILGLVGPFLARIGSRCATMWYVNRNDFGPLYNVFRA